MQRRFVYFPVMRTFSKWFQKEINVAIFKSETCLVELEANKMVFADEKLRSQRSSVITLQVAFFNISKFSVLSTIVQVIKAVHMIATKFLLSCFERQKINV